jgi:hypothetical protein
MNLELSNALLTFKRWLICILFNEYLCAVYCLPGTFFFLVVMVLGLNSGPHT